MVTLVPLVTLPLVSLVTLVPLVIPVTSTILGAHSRRLRKQRKQG